MDPTADRIARAIATEIAAAPRQVAAAVALLDEGATVPFVARYRKEATGGLDDTQLRTLADRLTYLRDLEARRATILASIRDQGKLSDALARQIQQGAPADVFISANPGWMDQLEADGLIKPETRRDLLGNEIVLIAHDADAAPVTLNADLDLPAMLGDAPLAMALVDAVPAGIYGRTALQSLGLWDSVAPHVAQADNVRAALALVALGEAPLGVVYATDAAAEPDVTVIGIFPEDSHDPILYPVAALADSANPLTADLLNFLSGPEACAIFEGQGFTWAVD